jgi:hypothetical protein
MVASRRGLDSDFCKAERYMQPARIAWRYREITALVRLRENARGVSHQQMLDTVIAFDVIAPEVAGSLDARRSE